MFTLKYTLNYIEIKNHNLGSLLPTIVAFVIHIHPLSSPLLLRISPHTFAFIPIQPMSLSSRNRSNSKAFCHILPCVAPFCKGMHYHKTGVPWQMNNTFIIVVYLHSFNYIFCSSAFSFNCNHTFFSHCFQQLCCFRFTKWDIWCNFTYWFQHRLT